MEGLSFDGGGVGESVVEKRVPGTGGSNKMVHPTCQLSVNMPYPQHNYRIYTVSCYYCDM